MAAKESKQLSKVTDVRFNLDVVCKMFDPVLGRHFDKTTDLLVVVTKFGTRIIGRPTSPELLILYFKDEKYMPRSKFALRGIPKILSLNCTESILAVNYNANGIAFVDLYFVQSFLSSRDLIFLNSLRFDCMARQILWNPIESNMFAICLGNSSLDICMFNGKDQFISKRIARENARCLCWNSEGKQIVYASANGALKQCDLDRGMIKTIDAPPGLLGQPHEPIALKWLSMHQFAIIFLESSNDAQPKFFIVNTNGGQPTYIKVDDIYYSPQTSQVYLLYLSKWNVILTGSRNDAQINVLTANASTESPTWTKINSTDEKRARIPLGVAGRGPFSMLGITLETQTSNFVEGSPLMAMILTCGRVVTVKLVLSKTMPASSKGNASGAGYLAHRFEMPSEVRASKEDLFKAPDFSTFRKLAADPKDLGSLRSGHSPSIYDQDHLGAILSFNTMRELISAAAQKFLSVVRNALEATNYQFKRGNSGEWLNYLILLESAAEVTEEEMGRTKNALHSIISILSKVKAESPEKPDLFCDKSHHEEGPSSSSIVTNVETEKTETGKIQPVSENTGVSLASSRQKRSATKKTKIPNKNDSTLFSYACRYCDKRYKQEGNLRKHLAKHQECKLMALKAQGDKADVPIGIGMVPVISEAETVVHETNVSSETVVESKKRPKKKEMLHKIDEPSPFAHIANVHPNKKLDRKSSNAHKGNSRIDGGATSLPPGAIKQGNKRSVTMVFSHHQIGRSPDTHPFLCDICNNRYLNKSTLSKHMIVHGLKPLQRKSVKADKKNVSNGDGPTGTVKQGRKGSTKRNAQQKTAVSHPFLCNICGDRYKHNGRLTEHRRRDHTKKLSLTICPPIGKLPACENQQTNLS